MRTFFAICLAAVSLAAQNLIKNGNFAERKANGKPADWVVWPSKMPEGASLELDTTMSASAGCSVRIMQTKTDMYSRVEQVVPCKPHTNYIAFFKSMGKEINSPHGGVVRMYIGPHGSLDKQLISFGPAFDYYQLERPANWSYPWKRYESKVFNSGDSEAFGVCVYLNRSSGIVWIDDVELFEYTPELRKEVEAGIGRRQLMIDLECMRANAQGQEKVLKKLDDFAVRIAKWHPENRSAPLEGMPYYELHRELIAVNADILQRRYPGRGLVVSEAAPLHPGAHLKVELPPLRETIEVLGLRGELEPFALDFTNCKSVEKEVTLLPPENLTMELRIATAVELDEGKSVDDALVLLRPDEKGQIRFRVPGGMTRQLYCAVHLPDQAGTFPAQLKWHSGNEAGSVKLLTTASQAVMPAMASIHSFGYLCHNHGSFWRRGEVSKAILSRMHQNAEMISHVTTLRGVFDDAGIIQPEKMNWREVDKTLAILQPGSLLIFNVLLTHNPYMTLFIGKNGGQEIIPFSPEWESRVTQYMKAVIAGFKERGLGYDRFVFCLKDEPTASELVKMEKMAAVIRKTDPQVRIYNDFNSVLKLADVRKLASFVDIISPHKNRLSPDYFEIFRGKEVWCYWVQNKGVPGYLLKDFFLELKQKDVRAFSYWCMAGNGNPWTATRQSYSVIFPGDEQEWIPSKRSEGIREGIEDYTLLTLLEQQDSAYYQRIMETISPENWKSLRKEILGRLK